MAQNTLTIALSKGRILKETLPLLAAADIHPLDDPDSSRKLILDTNQPHIKLLAVRATDAPTYVNYGTADLGVAGKDVLMEIEGENLYELVDLGIARCRLMVAGQPGFTPAGHRLRVATKYVRSAQRYFAEKGEQVELIKLYGSMELAPLVGLSDVIVDLVDTGNTLKANGLAPMEHIADISSRLIVNQHAYKLKHDMIRELVQHIQEAVNNG
ncbi:ATP phosphoribosyltransferase (homohexameric) [Sulfurivirga caldicuralii]|uniref:ATP phosphoribosyltransferase n=1 Tax=Sulfurivirga caldicuralii TaxID=364032 RepID=A0A1N6G2U6_9GAMM|nr:ATP phosphoribosyltransferase [Sulfurivirga caldicuralii]SIO01865.1 ATP phosphoribosyltransferase (homohexameric) [Sulfurivirga caldicuralii]